MDIKAGSTDQSVSFAAFTTATGAAVTVTSATAGLSLWYRRGTAGSKTAISPSDLSALTDAHADGGILVVGGQEHRLDLPDAAVAAGVDRIEWGGEATGITIDGGTANLVGQATTGAVGEATTDAIKTKTDGLNFTGTDVKATLDGEEVTTDAASRNASKADVSALALESTAQQILEDTGTTIPALIADLDVGTGSGPNEVVLTFVDQDETAVQSVSVGIYDGGVLTALGSTIAGGTLTVYLASGTYDVRAFKTGYQFTAGQTLEVDGVDDDAEFTITRLTPAPSTELDRVTGRYLCHVSRVPDDGVEVSLAQYATPSGEVGNAWDNDIETQTSDANGYVYFTDLIVGAKYRIRRGNEVAWTIVTIPADADEDGYVDLTSLIG